MSLHGLDLNATCVRAVRGPLGDYPFPELLEPPRAELPLVLSLEGRTPVIGSAGLGLCRRAPQLVWQNFLPRLGEASPPGRQWLEGYSFLFSKRNASFLTPALLSTSTTTWPPFSRAPKSSSSVSARFTSSCMTRASGRAPLSGSYPASAR